MTFVNLFESNCDLKKMDRNWGKVKMFEKNPFPF